MQLTGGHVSYQHNRIRLGITGIYYLFNRPYEPELTGYSKYNLHGNNFYNLGIDYAYRWHRFSFQGGDGNRKTRSAIFEPFAIFTGSKHSNHVDTPVFILITIGLCLPILFE